MESFFLVQSHSRRARMTTLFISLSFPSLLRAIFLTFLRGASRAVALLMLCHCSAEFMVYWKFDSASGSLLIFLRKLCWGMEKREKKNKSLVIPMVFSIYHHEDARLLIPLGRAHRDTEVSRACNFTKLFHRSSNAILH